MAATATNQLVRLNKYLAQKGLCSRREADNYIQQGLVRVNHVIIDHLGYKIDPQLHKIELMREAHSQQDAKRTVMLNKPLGIVSSQPDSWTTIPAVTLLKSENRFAGDRKNDTPRVGPNNPHQLTGWAACGRLDINSTGLLILSQSGVIAQQLISPQSQVEKEYLVRLEQKLDNERARDNVSLLLDGVSDQDDFLTAKKIEILNENQLRVVLTQGRHHHIRRMCQAVGWQVQALKRVRIGRIHLEDLPLGGWRYLQPRESFV